jgi:hypothetical protein
LQQRDHHEQALPERQVRRSLAVQTIAEEESVSVPSSAVPGLPVILLPT